MKKRTLLTLGVCLASVLGIGLTTASAHSMDVRVTLPFAATVGSVTLPAGDYTIQSLSGNSSAVVFRSANGSAVTAATIQVSDSSKSSGQTEVMFQRTDGKYSIDKIFVAGQAFELVQ